MCLGNGQPKWKGLGHSKQGVGGGASPLQRGEGSGACTPGEVTVMSVCYPEDETEGPGSTRTVGSRNVAAQATEALGPWRTDERTRWRAG